VRNIWQVAESDDRNTTSAKKNIVHSEWHANITTKGGSVDTSSRIARRYPYLHVSMSAVTFVLLRVCNIFRDPVLLAPMSVILFD
jgi:hypothetical protein